MIFGFTGRSKEQGAFTSTVFEAKIKRLDNYFTLAFKSGFYIYTKKIRFWMPCTLIIDEIINKMVAGKAKKS